MRKRRNIYLDDDQYAMLQALSYARTAEEQHAVSVAELIRRAIERTYSADRADHGGGQIDRRVR